MGMLKKISLDHKNIRRSVWLVLILFVLFGYSLQSVAGSAYYSMVKQAYATVSSPPVILEEGNCSGTSTIYSNGTSAKVNVTAPVWLTGWQDRKRISIKHTNVDSNLTDFPLYVKIVNDTDIGASARSDGYDIRFTFSDGATLLKYERETFTITEGKANGDFWVKVPTVSSFESTIIYIYYGKSDATDGADPTNVWSVNTLGVWHMSDGPSNTLEDYTANNNTVNKRGTNQPSEVNGKIAKAQYFNADWAWATAKENLNNVNNTSGFTISAWYKPDGSNPSYHYLLTKNTDALSNVQYGMYIRTPNTGGVMGAAINGLAVDITGSSRVWTNGVWHHVVLTWDGASLRGYVNGVQVGSVSHTNTMTPQGNFINLGRRSNAADGSTSSGAFRGTLDEIRLENVTRSASWIKFEYYNIASEDNELTWESEESLVPTYDFVDNNTSDVDSSADRGTHSNFTAQQYGPDSIYDTLTEVDTGSGIAKVGTDTSGMVMR
jgi:hypothetical protein